MGAQSVTGTCLIHGCVVVRLTAEEHGLTDDRVYSYLQSADIHCDRDRHTALYIYI